LPARRSNGYDCATIKRTLQPLPAPAAPEDGEPARPVLRLARRRLPLAAAAGTVARRAACGALRALAGCAPVAGMVAAAAARPRRAGEGGARLLAAWGAAAARLARAAAQAAGGGARRAASRLAAACARVGAAAGLRPARAAAALARAPRPAASVMAAAAAGRLDEVWQALGEWCLPAAGEPA
jgi:hypothetical protein